MEVTLKTNNSVEGNNVITLKHGDSMLDITASMQFISDKHLQYGIRTSLENFGALEKVQIIPLYALSTIFKCNSQMPLHDGL